MQPQTPTLRAALALLGLSDGAPREAVTRAYHRLALVTHPDLSDAADAATRFAALTAAYRRALAAAPTQVAATPPLATEPTTFPTRSRARPQSVDPRARLFGSAGASAPIIVVGPGRIEPLLPQRPPAGEPR